jgi:NitT/TauT family transport system permease protein
MIWFGFGLTPRVLLVALLVFFPVVVNTLAGMNLTDRNLVNLFAANRATQLDYFLKLRLKSALPLVYAGLEIGIVQALLGAVVSEFVAAESGIGSTILQFQSVSNTAGAFACLVILAIVGVILYAVIRLIRNRVIFWQKSAFGTARGGAS